MWPVERPVAWSVDAVTWGYSAPGARAFNEGLATDDLRLKIENLLFGLFYLASALREVATMSASNLHNNLGDALSDHDVRQELQIVERSVKERKPNGKP